MMIPHRTPVFLPLLYPSLTWRMQAEKKDLYLTFDDGPVPGPTEFVLDQLAAASIKATFFCIGDNIRKHPQVFKKILEAGHTIGNHTCTHLNGWKTSSEKYLADIQEFEKIVSHYLDGFHTLLFRPPYGRISRKQIQALRHYKIIMWDVLSLDYDQRLSAESCLQGSIRACRPGSIIVFHDSYKSQKNMEYILPRLIAYGLGKGFTFRPM
jgi:peptidoglycan/xylan/chitin deacetylase (PgdA/CDA1 family)